MARRSFSVSTSRRALTTCSVMSSWMANTSLMSRSYRSDQRWKPSEALMSWTETRRRSPALRTLPSSTVVTCICSAMEAKSVAFPRNWKEAVRDATRSSGILVSAWMSSSASPSQK